MAPEEFFDLNSAASHLTPTLPPMVVVVAQSGFAFLISPRFNLTCYEENDALVVYATVTGIEKTFELFRVFGDNRRLQADAVLLTLMEAIENGVTPIDVGRIVVQVPIMLVELERKNVTYVH